MKAITMAKESKGIPSGLFSRATKLLGTGAALLGQEALSRVSSQHPDSVLARRMAQAQRLVDSLGQLKGAAMKAGQMLSLELSDLLPPEVTEILRKLHQDADFMPFTQVERILKKEWSPDAWAQVGDISKEPIAAASIGQVHLAEYCGKKIAVKVQFPGVSKSIGSDLALVRKAVESFLWLQGKSIDLVPVFKEMESVLRHETDYIREAEHLVRFGQYIHDRHISYFVVPQVYQDLSTKRVLSLSYEEGLSTEAWLCSPRNEHDNSIFAALVLGLLLLELMDLGEVQSDPNYGNFLWRPQDRAIVLLDFGALKRYPKRLRRDLKALLMAAQQQDRQSLLEIAERCGYLDKRESDGVKEMFIDLMTLITRIFDPALQPFRFAEKEYLQRIRSLGMSFGTQVRYTAPARELVFLNRKLAGMFHLLKDADARLDTQPFWKRFVEWDG